ELLFAKLHDPDGAIDVYEDIVASDPRHEPTIQALEALVVDPERQGRITQILGPLYREADQWMKLIAVLEAEVGLEQDPLDRARLSAEIAELHERRGESPARAFEARARAFTEVPHDEEARSELDRLAATLGNWDEQVAAYEAALPKADDPSLVSELL